MRHLSSGGVDLELVRQQWQEGRRRVEAARSDGPRYARLHAEVDVVLAELRRRVGQRFTLEELARAYAGADDWARTLLQDATAEDSPPPEVSTAVDAAFHLYTRGATDYAP
jgi:hypothetical protein